MSHNFIIFANFVCAKVIKVGGNLMKFWQIQFCTV